MLSISIAVFLVHSLLCSPCWARVAVCLWNSLFIVLCLRDSVVAPWAAGPLFVLQLVIRCICVHTYIQPNTCLFLLSVIINNYTACVNGYFNSLIFDTSSFFFLHSLAARWFCSTSTHAGFFIYLFRDSCFWTPEPTSCALLVNSLPPSLPVYFILVSLSPCNLGQKRTNMSLSSSKNVWNPPKVVYPFL